MNDIGCERARELIPLLSVGTLESSDREAAEAHLVQCGECRQEADLARILFATRPVPPDGMAERITDAVRRQGRTERRPWWGLSAAAVAVLALGLGVMSGREVAPVTVPLYAAETGQSGLWLSDDGLIAGAPSFDALSDEALEQLLDELEAGGAA
jgi:predicted anti-sigma-YlaC factor YlaD